MYIAKPLEEVIEKLKVEIKAGCGARDKQLSRIGQRNNDLRTLVIGEFQGKINESVHSQLPSELMSATQTKLFGVIQREAQALHTDLQGDSTSPKQRCCQVYHHSMRAIKY